MTHEPPPDPNQALHGQQPYPPQQGHPPVQYPPAATPKKKGSAGKVLLTTPAAPSHVGLNQAARDGKFEFVVSRVTCGVAKIGDEALNKTAQGQFCEVAVSVKNIGTQPQTFDGGAQKAKGADGATYANDGVAEIYANKDSATFLNEINPGNQVSGILVFDIPKTAKIASLELHDSAFSQGVVVTV
ncbi:MAG: hypothetical protein AUG44_15350 [Actinobacteria bacterium 13_1_20CM_3_71_11]|nr:MAG: hypothetical protein AUG44_15350 [Actinobacteria bacterium 13_1_20CM_3_71_11]